MHMIGASETPSNGVYHGDDDLRARLEAQLALRDAMLQAVSYAAQRFLGAEPFDDCLPQVLERLGIASATSRISLFECHRGPSGATEAQLRHQWIAPHFREQNDARPLARFPLAATGLGRWEAILERGDAISGHVRALPDSEREALGRAGVLSIAVAPVQVGGAWWGYIGFSACDTERDWSAGEIGALKASAGIIGAALERGRLDQELRRHSLQDEIILAQQAALQELSTPLMAISDSAMVMPLVGAIDSGRAQQIIETLLEGVSAHRASVAIIDITGVSVVDTQVANALLRAAQAVKLLGAQVVLTGIRPEIAQTLVGLGVDLGGLITRSTLQAGIAFAIGQR
jgi:anti-anti-sigma regulatory factor